MLKDKVTAVFRNAIASLVELGQLPAEGNDVGLVVQRPAKGRAGDYASPVSMQLAKCTGVSPDDVAQLIMEQFAADPDAQEMFDRVEFAAPGFINVFLRAEFVASEMAAAMDTIGELHYTPAADPENYCVEFVSVNPNGPVTVGSGRGAALGDAVSRVLTAAGHRVTREYYINDGVNSEQMRLFGASVKHHALSKSGVDSAMPKDGYKGDYVEAIADELLAEHGADALAKMPDLWYREQAQAKMLAKQKSDLLAFGVRFNEWVSEQSLFEQGKVDIALDALRSSGAAQEREGALWLQSTGFGDDQDRVLVRNDNRPTYIAGDVAYHHDKYERGHTRLIDVLGADHHGYIPRLKAAVAAMGHDPETLDVLVFQTVRFVKDGAPQLMRKRDGNVYALDDLIRELGQKAAPGATESEQVRVGADMTRFFYLNTSHDRHMDFDIDLAVEQSSQNPCFYAQYAHARARSVLQKALGTSGGGLSPDDVSLEALAGLVSPEERSLALRCLELPGEVVRCAGDYGVHRLAAYSVEVAKLFHDFYEKHKVIQTGDRAGSEARLALTLLAAEAVRQALGLLGVSAPETMQRD